MNRYKNLLTPTTLIPLWSKAADAESTDPILGDRHAVEILNRLGYDLNYYDRRKHNPSLVGCCLRAKWMDDRTLEFINNTGRCQVIQLGAGLDDRFRRTGMPDNVMYWYDLDLKEVTDMRRENIPEVERNEFISMNLFDTAWMHRMKDNGLPVLVIIEGVMMFLEESAIKMLFENMASILGEVTILFDSVPSVAVGRAKYHDAVRQYNGSIEYTWGIKDGNDLERMFPDAHLEEITYMSDLPGADRFCTLLRMAYRIPFFYRRFNQMLVKIKVK